MFRSHAKSFRIHAVRSESYLPFLSRWLIDEIAWQKLKYSHGMQIEATRRDATRSITCRLDGSTRACTPICRYPVNRRIHLTRGSSGNSLAVSKMAKRIEYQSLIVVKSICSTCTANVYRRCRFIRDSGRGRGNIFINLRSRIVDRRICLAQGAVKRMEYQSCWLLLNGFIQQTQPRCSLLKRWDIYIKLRM